MVFFVLRMRTFAQLASGKFFGMMHATPEIPTLEISISSS